MRRSAVMIPLATLLMPAAVIADVEEATLTRHVAYLAADLCEGRGPGTAGIDSAAAYVERELSSAGLSPLFGDGYRQRFEGAGHALVNIGAIVAGTPGESHVILGAHYDHLGISQEGEIFPGADDNASGVAALLQIARRLAAGPAPRRSIVFLAFSGEEQGLLGSAHYAADPALPLGRCAAMINLDSVGRLREDRLVVFGSGTASVFEATLEGLNRSHHFAIAMNPEGVGAGDHETFFARGVPVLHLFTDAHLDYHQTTDTPDRLNVPGLVRVTAFAGDLLEYLADDAVVLSFVPAGAEKLAARSAATARRRTVTLGTIPDFARDSGGVRVAGIVPGSPAETVGLRVDDVIVAVDGTLVDNLQDYSAILKERSPGDEIAVTVVREEDRIVVHPVLVKRR